jgi:hypothetical protein
MSEPTLKIESDQTAERDITVEQIPGDKPTWETPEMQDVSEEVMAQPYIRFT